MKALAKLLLRLRGLTARTTYIAVIAMIALPTRLQKIRKKQATASASTATKHSEKIRQFGAL